MSGPAGVADMLKACNETLEGIKTWQYLAYAVLGLNLVNIIAFSALARNRTKWSLLWRLSVFIGIVKILASGLLIAVVPDSSGCSDPALGVPAPSMAGLYVCPALSILLGVYWIKRGMTIKQLSAAPQTAAEETTGAAGSTLEESTEAVTEAPSGESSALLETKDVEAAPSSSETEETAALKASA